MLLKSLLKSMVGGACAVLRVGASEDWVGMCNEQGGKERARATPSLCRLRLYIPKRTFWYSTTPRVEIQKCQPKLVGIELEIVMF